MSSPTDFPEITFKCPKVWTQMRGDERTRFCEVCKREVHNLSMMSRQERRALLTAEGESPCVAYFQDVNGAAIDVTALQDADPLKKLLTRAAALSLSTMSLLPSCTTTPPPEPNAVEKNPAAMGVGSIRIMPSHREMLQRTVQGG